jgi:hypothetical protein
MPIIRRLKKLSAETSLPAASIGNVSPQDHNRGGVSDQSPYREGSGQVKGRPFR